MQEYLRRAAQLPIDADKIPFTLQDDEDENDRDESGSVISEATLDELARISELDDPTLTMTSSSTTSSPEWRAADASSQSNQQPLSTAGGEITIMDNAKTMGRKSSLRLPETILQQAKLRKKAQQHAVAAAAAAAAVSSGIARKDRENHSANTGL